MCVCVCMHARVCYKFVMSECQKKIFREEVHSPVSDVKLVGCFLVSNTTFPQIKPPHVIKSIKKFKTNSVIGQNKNS